MNPFSVLRYETDSATRSTSLSPRFAAVDTRRSVDLAKSECSGQTFVIVDAGIRL